jgi:SNF2 family DNA or RNA helicase
LVVDESTKFKRANTKRFKLLKSMLGHFNRRYILTGTPTPNGLLDLFGQIFILDHGERLGRYITHYRNAFFFQTGFGGYKWIPKHDAFDQIVDKLSSITLRLDAKDYLDLPPRIVTDIPVDLPKAAFDQYKRLEKDFVLQLKKGDVTAFNAGALSVKLRQLTGGFMYLDHTQGKYEQVHGAKMDALVDLYESLQGAPLLVSYEFQPERQVLCDYFDAPYIGGGVTAKRGRELVKSWNHGDIPILFAHPQSVAHGLNLQDGGHHLCIYTPTWNLEYYEQFIRRLDRQGQKHPVNVYRLVVPGTVDRTVLRGIEKKDGDQRSLLDALKEDLL